MITVSIVGFVVVSIVAALGVAGGIAAVWRMARPKAPRAWALDPLATGYYSVVITDVPNDDGTFHTEVDWFNCPNAGEMSVLYGHALHHVMDAVAKERESGAQPRAYLGVDPDGPAPERDDTPERPPLASGRAVPTHPTRAASRSGDAARSGIDADRAADA